MKNTNENQKMVSTLKKVLNGSNYELVTRENETFLEMRVRSTQGDDFPEIEIADNTAWGEGFEITVKAPSFSLKPRKAMEMAEAYFRAADKADLLAAWIRNAGYEVDGELAAWMQNAGDEANGEQGR